MPIEVITGLPGHGKTLLLVSKLIEAAEKAERPLFVCGVDGLKPGLARTLEDPTQWDARDANGEHLVPDGALIFVDEAWKWYGHLHNARSQPNPPHVLQFAEHRHRGLDFVMTTQGPGQLYPFLRSLIEGHTHVVRTMGMQVAQLYTWPELNEDVKSRTMRDLAIRKVWPYPKKVFDAYKSATQHTIKRKIPTRIFLLPVLVIAGLSLGYLGLKSLSPSAMADTLTEGRASGLPDAAPAVAPAASETSAPARMTAEEWLQRFQPRVPQMPMSAPAFDDRPVLSEPRVFCAIGERLGCRCLTEQGTRYEMDQQQCVALVNSGGVYDPFRAPRQEQNIPHASGALADDKAAALPVAPDAAPQVSGARSTQQVASYGGFRQ